MVARSAMLFVASVGLELAVRIVEIVGCGAVQALPIVHR